jgi:hypothetical protein
MRDAGTGAVSVTQRCGRACCSVLRQSRRRSSDAVCFSSTEPDVRGVKFGECSTASHFTGKSVQVTEGTGEEQGSGLPACAQGRCVRGVPFLPNGPWRNCGPSEEEVATRKTNTGEAKMPLGRDQQPTAHYSVRARKEVQSANRRERSVFQPNSRPTPLLSYMGGGYHGAVDFRASFVK